MSRRPTSLVNRMAALAVVAVVLALWATLEVRRRGGDIPLPGVATPKDVLDAAAEPAAANVRLPFPNPNDTEDPQCTPCPATADVLADLASR